MCRSAHSSVGTQGKVLSIPALVKRFILGNSVTAIWKRQDRGGKRVLALCLVLDLTPSHELDAPLAGAIIALVTALLRMSYVVHVLAYAPTGLWVVHVGGDAWETASKARLLSVLAAAAGARGGRGAADPYCVPDRPAAGGCHIRQAIALGVQLLLASPLATTSPKMLWLLTAGVAHSARGAISGVCAAAEAKSVEVLALSLRGADLRPLGCPRWLSVGAPAHLPSLLAAVFADERPRPPAEPPVGAGAVAAVLACATSEPKQLRRTGPDAAAGLAAKAMAATVASAAAAGGGGAITAAAASVGGVDVPCNVYLSGALDYTTSAPEEDGEEAPPPQEDPMDDEIEAFFKKVRSSWRQVRSNPQLRWTKKGLSAHDGAIMARIFVVETREVGRPSSTVARRRPPAAPHLDAHGHVRGHVRGRVRGHVHGHVHVLAARCSHFSSHTLCVDAIAWQAAPWTLRNLSVENNALGDPGLATLSWALSKGALANLTKLNLTANRIGHDGLVALATALAAGALPMLEWLFLNGNRITDSAICALAAVVAGKPAVDAPASVPVASALPRLQQLWLHENQIGDEGVRQLLGTGGLQELTYLSLDKNPIQRAGVAIITQQISRGALPKLKNFMLSDILAGPRAQKDVAEALQKRAGGK